MSVIDAWVPAARTAMQLVERAIARPATSLIDDAGRHLARASTQLDCSLLASSGQRTIMADATARLTEAAQLVRADSRNVAAATSKLQSARFGIDLLLPYGALR